MPEQTLTLLGDSILDNASYTAPEPDTATHLRHLLPDWSINNLAVDGAIMQNVGDQLDRIDGSCGTAILSVGGNDAIEHMDLLTMQARTSGDVLSRLLRVADAFGREYEIVAGSVAGVAERTVLCTIYEVPLDPPELAALARVPLALLNDRIIRTGRRLGLEILELRDVCTQPADFVLQIEPSAGGALKIAQAIAALVTGA